MHCNYFSDRIYVKKTPKQCCLGNRNSQKAKVGVQWDRYSSKGSDGQQVWDQDSPKGMGYWPYEPSTINL